MILMDDQCIYCIILRETAEMCVARPYTVLMHGKVGPRPTITKVLFCYYGNNVLIIKFLRHVP